VNSIIERAIQLADSGRFSSVEEICNSLRADGYLSANRYLLQESTQRELHARLVAARKR
jgi:hypothetical protein